jgi:hypothetical protein
MFTHSTYVDVEPEERTGRSDSEGGKASEEVEQSDDDERVGARSEGHVQARLQTQRRFSLPEDRSESLSEERRALFQIDGGRWKQGGEGKESEVLYAHGDFKHGSVGCLKPCQDGKRVVMRYQMDGAC